MKNNPTTPEQRQRYEEKYAKWKMVNIKPDTKQKLAELSVMMGSIYSAVPQATVLDVIINDYYNKMKNI